ncbi:MAG: response regulator transcription factor [Pseudomonadota bacterium]
MSEATVFVVDDDAALRRSIAFLAESVGWRVRAFADPQEFLPDLAGGGCLVLDVRMPGMSGLELQRELQARRIELPIVFITGHGDIAMAVQAMKDGALDFIEKPFKDQQLLDAIARAMRVSAKRQEQASRQAEYRRLLCQLTQREREVAALVARGLSNKLIARELDISDKTVQVHRANLMDKMGVHSAAELAQILMRAEEPGENY